MLLPLQCLQGMLSKCATQLQTRAAWPTLHFFCVSSATPDPVYGAGFCLCMQATLQLKLSSSAVFELVHTSWLLCRISCTGVELAKLVSRQYFNSRLLLYLQAVVQQLLFLFLSHKRSNKENEHVTQYCPLSSFSLSRRSGKTNPVSTEEKSNSLHLDWDTLQEVISCLAYPISQWSDNSASTIAAGQAKAAAVQGRLRS